MSSPFDYEAPGRMPGAPAEYYLVDEVTTGLADPSVLPDGDGKTLSALLDGQAVVVETVAAAHADTPADLGANVLANEARVESPIVVNGVEFGTHPLATIASSPELRDAYIGPSEAADRTEEVFALRRDPETFFEVEIETDVTLEDYEEITPTPVMELARREATTMLEEALAKGQRNICIVEAGSTWEGGGVAMQVGPFMNFTIKLLRDIIEKDERFEGMAAEGHWLVGFPDEEAFETTKFMHNGRQLNVEPGAQFTEEMQAIHTRYGEENYGGVREFREGMPEPLRHGMKHLAVFQRATHLILDDPQLAAMLPLIERDRPDLQVDTRNHIQTNRDSIADPDSLQHAIETYLIETCHFNNQHAYMAHPVEQFVPYGTENVAFVPPICDPFEDLNRPQDMAERERHREWINSQIEKQNRVRQMGWAELYNETYGVGNWDEAWAHVDDQDAIPWDKPGLFILDEFSRYDWAKVKWVAMYMHKYVHDELTEIGTPEALEARGNLLTIITGNGATDDGDKKKILPEILGRVTGNGVRDEVYAKLAPPDILEQMSGQFAAYRDGIRVVGFEHNYAAVNALERDSKIHGSYSTEDGFEHRPTETIIKENPEGAEEYGNVPAIVSDGGGLPLQVREGVSGHVVHHIEQAKRGYIPDGSELEAELKRVAHHVAGYMLDSDKYAALKESTHDEAQAFHKVTLGTPANTIRVLRVLNGNGNRLWRMEDLLAEAEEKLAA
jgi:hypothetical protein